MHSSRMRTARSSSRPGGSPPGTPLGADPPDQASPQEQTHPWTRHPPGTDPPDQATPRSRHPPDQAPPVDRITDACENITLPQQTFSVTNTVSDL